MRPMGHRDVKTAMHDQHPELEIVCPPRSTTVHRMLKQRCSEERLTTTFATHRKTTTSASH